MDFNLADYAQQMPPEERQQMMAQLLRKQQGADQLRNANAQANQYGNLAAISQMANNEGVAGAAQMANKSAQAQYSPVQMGQTGFMLPGSGDMVENPIYTEEKDAARKSTLTLTRERLAQQAELDRQRREDRKDQQARDLEYKRDRDAQGNALRETLATIAGGRANEAKDAVKSKDLDKTIQKYSANLEKGGVPEFDSALGTVEDTLKKYAEGKLPAYGRFVGGVPNALLDAEGQIVRSNMAGAANILLKIRSGAAVTDPEMRRFLTEVASGAGMEEKALRNGWANIRKHFNSRLSNFTTQLTPEQHDEYIGRGGTDYRMKQADSKQPSLPPGLVLPPGAQYVGPAQ